MHSVDPCTARVMTTCAGEHLGAQHKWGGHDNGEYSRESKLLRLTDEYKQSMAHGNSLNEETTTSTYLRMS